MNEIYLREKLSSFLAEDLGHVVLDYRGSYLVEATISAEEPGIFCGGHLIAKIFNLLVGDDVAKVEMRFLLEEGKLFAKGDVLAKFLVNSEVLLNGIRTVLNLLSRMTEVATHTHKAVQGLAGTSCKLLDTRKTTPGLRAFEKYAAKIGGAVNHRFGRYDGILLKKEDIRLRGSVIAAIDRAMQERSHLEGVEIEVETLEELDEVLKDGRVKYILLDNMSLDTMAEAVRRCGATHVLEASGIGDKRLGDVARTGVHYISSSSLVRGAPPIKMHMRVTASA